MIRTFCEVHLRYGEALRVVTGTVETHDLHTACVSLIRDQTGDELADPSRWEVVSHRFYTQGEPEVPLDAEKVKLIALARRLVKLQSDSVLASIVEEDAARVSRHPILVVVSAELLGEMSSTLDELADDAFNVLREFGREEDAHGH